jgi:hypothetical protein
MRVSYSICRTRALNEHSLFVPVGARHFNKGALKAPEIPTLARQPHRLTAATPRASTGIYHADIISHLTIGRGDEGKMDITPCKDVILGRAMWCGGDAIPSL